MDIAVIGWGSLIWCPGNLKIKTKWHSDGPRLPIEFARISKDRRLTLVILAGSHNKPTYWALSEFKTLPDARQNLREREGTGLTDIHSLTADGQAAGEIPTKVRAIVRHWLATRDDVCAAIWTGLTTNWPEKRGCDFTPQDAIRYLKGLESERDLAEATYNRAREYVTNAPPQIQTMVRRAMQRLGWQDNDLPRVLFED